MTLKTGYNTTQNLDAVVVSRSGTERNLAINHNPIVVSKGFDTFVTFSIKDDSRRPQNLNNVNLTGTLVTRLDKQPILQRNFRVIDPVSGIAQFQISKADARKLNEDSYYMLVSMQTENNESTLLYADQTHRSRFVVTVNEDAMIDYTDSIAIELFYVQSDISISQKIPSSSQNPESNGLHTVAIYTTDFTGEVHIEATLANSPIESDWFTVNDPTDIGIMSFEEETTGITPIAFDGRFAWVRFKLIDAVGTVDKILYRS